MRHSSVFLFTVLLLCVPGTLLAEDTVEVEAIEHKVLVDEPDFEGDLWVSVKLTVRNFSREDRNLRYEVQAFDAEGFEVFDIELSGKVDALEDRTLSDHSYVNADVYDTIVEWKVKD